jgi:MoaA/NifB/PqqE/SkfB family radical SAM enzyme
VKPRSETTLIAPSARDPYHSHKLFHPYHLQRARAFLDGQIPEPSTVEIDLTDGACNQACVHCCFGNGPHGTLRSVDPDLLIPFLATAYAYGTRAFELVGGGEPTNHPRVCEIIERIHDLGVDGDEEARIGLVSNGVRLARILAVAHHLEWVRISLDASDEATYCELHGVRPAQDHYAKVLSNISTLGEHVDPACIRLGYLVVPPINHQRDKILAAADLARAHGVQHIAFRPAFLSHTTRSEDWQEAANAISEAKQRHRTNLVLGGSGGSWDHVLGLREQPSGPCRTRPLVMVIKADGTIPSCILFRDRLRERPPLGNIADGFDAVWFSERHRRSLVAVNRRDCPAVCKHFRADAALDEFQDASANGHSTPAVVGVIDNPHFI